ncbi:putative ABC transport system permease protein [Dyadobacter sp. SG02]|uniref:ABC transporter permease n=1 Tax=Dyadobacter sp. SG02 TaxID=1855291 RepID=UPI0008B92665|nr:ABC transporter permease [Dyadobacter sp. SG02]SEI50559.1 putative ABC transport system permease protein [Dyadobacter sp. SG02]
MFKNYLKISWRNIAANKLYSTINLVGLAIGMCVCFFCAMFVHFELSYDSGNQKADRLYRLVTDVKTESGTDYKSTLGGMAPLIQQSLPEVKGATRIFPDYLVVQRDKNMYAEENVAYADPSIFSLFTIPLLSGDPSKVLESPSSIVLSETAAHKYFGQQPATGKILMLNGRDTVHVTGVMRDMPVNSHFRTDYLLPVTKLGKEWDSNWKRFFFYTYLELGPNPDIAGLNSKITKLVKEHTDQTQSTYELFLEPLRSVYLDGKPRGTRTGTSSSGSRQNVYIISVISLLVLFVSCFNFVNLTTAFSVRRMKEIGVRKVLGGNRKQLIVQFLLDSVLISGLASLAAILLILSLAPAFNALAGKIIIDSRIHLTQALMMLLPGALIVGIMAGIYPAIFLSNGRTINSLKGVLMPVTRGLSLNKVLIVSQFTVAVALIIATAIIYQQLDFMKNHEPGFKKDHLLVVDFQFDGQVSKQSPVLKHLIGGLDGSTAVSLSSSIPGRANHTYPTQIQNSRSELQELQADAYFIDHDFLKHYQIQMVAGRPFDRGLGSDSTEAMLINESACKALGFDSPEKAIGKRFQQLNRKGTIIGVTKDFHYHTLRETVRPLTFRVAPGFFTFVSISLPNRSVAETVAKLKAQWNTVIPNVPFTYFFADEAYHAQYVAEAQFGAFFALLAGIAVFLSCLGLVGISTLNISRRTAEIGIRKVLGATATEILALLTKDLFWQIAAALLIATPCSWYMMARWLQSYAYQTKISPWLFVASAFVAVFIAFLTVCFQSIKAALMVPVEAIRSE